MKVKVRIAVAINTKGDWYAVGSSRGKDDDDMEIALDSLDCLASPHDHRGYFVEAELEVPVTETVQGTVGQ